MGRHSLEDDRVFWRSVMFFALKWMGVVALPLLAVWGIWRLVRQPEERAVAPRVATISSPTPSPSPLPESPVPSPSPSPPVSPSPAEKGQVQVLNGTSTTGLANRASAKLKTAGYEVVSVGNSARPYEETTVFFKPGFEQMGRDIAAILGTGKVEPAPETLTRDIPVTVVVGPDFEG